MPHRAPPLRSILLCADRTSEAQIALRKASILARHLGASMELFGCDTGHAWAAARAHSDPVARAELAACVLAERRYLAALRGSIAAADLRLTTRAVCAASFADAVSERVREAGHDLVIKCFTDAALSPRASPSAADMALVQACRVRLLLTRPRSWHPAPRIWAALDLQRCDAREGRRVVDTARALARDCHGSFELVYSRRGANAAPPSTRSLIRAAELLGVEVSRLHLLEGDPREALPPALEAGRVDVLVIMQPAAAAAPVAGASLTERLLCRGDCDVLIVPASPAVAAGMSDAVVAALGPDAAQGKH